jgi:ankyrin repeat protein
MVKMLLEDPRLAKHKDFISGYTALHWAAKHGKAMSRLIRFSEQALEVGT